MCGRISVALSFSDFKTYLNKTFQIESVSKDIKLPRFNVSPSQGVIAILPDGLRFKVDVMHWGMMSTYAEKKGLKNLIINAKSETIKAKETFKQAFKTRRCIILADGFFEWFDQVYKQPYRITLKNRNLFALAGLYTTWVDEDQIKYSTTIITTKANPQMEKIHDRMPVILSEDEAKIWLNPEEKDFDLLYGLLKPYQDLLDIYPVSKAVNDVKNDDKSVIEENKPIIEPLI